jgi:hypothetical protein
MSTRQERREFCRKARKAAMRRRLRRRLRRDLEARYHIEVTGYFASLRDPNDLDGPMLISAQTEDRGQLERAVGALVDAAGNLIGIDRARVGKQDEVDALKAALLDGLREMHRLQDEREDKRRAASEAEQRKAVRLYKRRGRVAEVLGQFESLPDDQTVALAMRAVPRKKGKR